MTITKQDFQAYEEVRESGETNMFDVKEVQYLAETLCDWTLEKEVIFEIMQNYSDYKDKFSHNKHD